MAVFVIATEGGDSQANYSIEVELDGTTFVVGFRYNSRLGSWFMSISDASGVILRSGVSVVSGFSLLERLKTTGKPEGRLIAVPVSDDTISAAGLNQLGREVLLTYVGDA